MQNETSSISFGVGQLGPDQVPVVRAEVAARYGAIGGSLDCDAVLRAWLSPGIPVLPLANLGITESPDSLSKLRHGERPRGRKVFMEVHEHRSYSVCYRLAIAFAAVALATLVA